jgi:hypothetical protein
MYARTHYEMLKMHTEFQCSWAGPMQGVRPLREERVAVHAGATEHHRTDVVDGGGASTWVGVEKR